MTLPLFYIKNRNQTTTKEQNQITRDHYFTSKIEIKPQLSLNAKVEYPIILHQK